jgi:hypothetical protein
MNKTFAITRWDNEERPSETRPIAFSFSFLAWRNGVKQQREDNCQDRLEVSCGSAPASSREASQFFCERKAVSGRSRAAFVPGTFMKYFPPDEEEEEEADRATNSTGMRIKGVADWMRSPSKKSKEINALEVASGEDKSSE